MSQQPSQAEPIYSSLGDDSDLGEIVELFVNEMPDRTAKLIEQREAEDWDELRRSAHQLKGAAGSYGFDQITPFAADLEASLRDGLPQEQIDAAFTTLVDFCNRVCAGAPR